MQHRIDGALAFIRHEATGGLLLAFAAVIALFMENSAGASLYDQILSTKLTLGLGDFQLDKPLLLWINDGLMAIFFFLVGLEIKRELLVGELSSVRSATLPAAAAVGGMLVPALVYAAVNYNSPETMRGWAIPAATDIAFALGVMALLGKRVPASLKIFLLALAIIDDLGAIIIIALFYTENLSLTALMLAGAGTAVLAAMNYFNVMRISPYVIVGIIIWVCVLKSGVHATLAGVVAALAIPLRGAPGSGKVGPLEHLEHTLHPWIKYFVLPVFAFANAGVSLAGLTFASLLAPIPLGIIAGLVIGKPIGIYLFGRAAVAAGLADLPPGSNWMQYIGVSWLAGIGFTMSLFIGMLAFPDPAFAADIRIGVLVGSLISGFLGFLVLSLAYRPEANTPQRA